METAEWLLLLLAISNGVLIILCFRLGEKLDLANRRLAAALRKLDPEQFSNLE